MTWADGALALALGIVGSMLAAYFYSHSSKLLDVAAAKWAQRSERAAKERLMHLNLELEDVMSLKSSDQSYLGRLAISVAQMLFYAMIMIILVVAVSMTEIKSYLASSRFELHSLFLFCIGASAMARIAVVRALKKVRDLSNLDARHFFLTREIEKIEIKLRFLP